MAIELHNVANDTPLPCEIGRLWGSSNNKLKLQMMLHEQVLKHKTNSASVQVIASCFPGTSVMVSCHSVKDGCLSELPDMNPDVEEADARIILHAMHAVKSGTERIVVLSSVLVQMYLCY